MIVDVSYVRECQSLLWLLQISLLFAFNLIYLNSYTKQPLQTDPSIIRHI